MQESLKVLIENPIFWYFGDFGLFGFPSISSRSVTGWIDWKQKLSQSESIPIKESSERSSDIPDKALIPSVVIFPNIDESLDTECKKKF